MRDLIFDIQRFCVYDGPGIRTTVFFKGCNMHCAWCHNPESFSTDAELLFRREKCTSCGACTAVCPNGAHEIKADGTHVFDRAKCAACGKCAEVCPNDVLELSGREMTVEAVMKQIDKDAKYYRSSKGGVTFSGGEASLHFELLKKLFPNIGLDDQLDGIQSLKDSKEAYKNGKSLQAQGEDGRAIMEYQKVIHADVNHDDAQTQIQNIRTAYKEKVLSDAQSRADEKDFLGAEAILMNSADILGDDKDIQAKLEEIKDAELNNYVETLLGTAKTLADDGDLPGAVNVLQDATRSDKRIDAQIATYRNQYKQKILDAAAKQAGESRYYDAVETLQNADDILSDDSDIAAKIEEYRALYPVSLTDLSPSDGEDCSQNWTAYDANGNAYSNGLNFSLYPVIAKTVYTEYAPNGQYKRLTGTWVVEGDTSDDFIGTVRIYVDDHLQYEVSSLTVNSPASALSLSISGASTVRIEVEGAFASLRAVGYLYLADAKFEN